jgi:DNA-directed RNA polymerase subunit RPC12/RpoP
MEAKQIPESQNKSTGARSKVGRPRMEIYRCLSCGLDFTNKTIRGNHQRTCKGDKIIID